MGQFQLTTCVHIDTWSGPRGSEGHSWEKLTAKLTGKEKDMERKTAVGTESHFACLSFLFAKPNCFHKTQGKIESLGACWVCRYKFTTSAACGQCTGWEAPRSCGELHSSILIAQGVQRGQKTAGHGRCVQRYVGSGGSSEDNTDCQQLSRLWLLGLGSGLSAQSHREQNFFV